MKYGKLTIITGPMWSGKTTELLRQFDRKVHAKLSCLLVKHGYDTRYSTDQVVTHVNTYGMSTKGHAVIYKTIADLIKGEGLFTQTYHTVFIDEIQFFPDKYLCLDLLNVGINVVIAGLNGDFNRKMFPGMDVLFASASEIKMLTAICSKCKSEDASFTVKLHEHTGHSREGQCHGKSSIDMGGSEKYMTVCLKCRHLHYN